MRTSTKGLIALMNREAVVLSTYKDSKGILTIGVGHTAAAGEPVPTSGLKITFDEALELFRRDVAKYEDDVNRAVTVPLAQHEFDALVSFHFNTGGIARAKLTEKLNAGDRIGAAAGFMGWLKPPEIKGRRVSEQKQFATGDYGDISSVLVYDTFPGQARRVSTADLFSDEPAPPASTPDEEPAVISMPPVEDRLSALESAYDGLLRQTLPSLMQKISELEDRVSSLET